MKARALALAGVLALLVPLLARAAPHGHGGRFAGGSGRGAYARPIGARQMGAPPPGPDRGGEPWSRGFPPPRPTYGGHHFAPSVRPWRRGGYLPPADEARGVDDYWRFHLRRPPYGYRWVEVGNQYLLVSTSTGLIFDVVPGR